jgi:hypothetical protein
MLSTPADIDGTPSILQHYQLTVSTFLTANGGFANSSATIVEKVKATEVLRDRVVKLIYVKSNKFL